MNERIKELAEQAANGLLSYHAEGDWYLSEKEVEKFAELIRADEREACAKLCEKAVSYYEKLYPIYRPPDRYTSGLWTMADHLEKAIRARGEVK